jgi:anaerobic magnesium-protoporphyrin IX monomethyl ester cyclase
MRVLLINPNRYASPPVPPIGLEYLLSSLVAQGHEARILDLCFSEDLYEDIDHYVRSFQPDIAGVTVRNVDTVLYHTNEFFLDQIREIVGHLKRCHGLCVMIGGAGLLSNPHGILGYLQADFAVRGPAEATVNDILKKVGQDSLKGKVFQGVYSGSNPCLRESRALNYKKYFEKGGVAGFETHKGCSSACVYCLEANTPVRFKEIAHVVGEIKSLVDMGCDHFHLCDSEFNEDNEYAIEFCSALRKAGLGIRWALYMKPAYASKSLFRLLKESGAYLITLTVDSWKKCPLYWEDYEKCIYSAKANGIRVAIDFLTGFPYETEDNLREYFDILSKPLPDSIGVSTYIRLYRMLKLTGIIFKDPELKKGLLGATDDSSMVKPVFYNLIDTEKLRQLFDGNPLFRIEGIEKGVNYSRVNP